MISAIVAVVSFVTIIVTTGILVAKGADLRKKYDDRLRTMTDQMNNAQYYNTQVDKQNIDSITDIRRTYSSKDDISRSVDTKSLSARKAFATDMRADSVTGEVMRFRTSTTDNLRANKFVAPGGVVGQLDASYLNASRINLTGAEIGKGALSFGSSYVGAESGDYLMQRGVEGSKNNVVMKMPTGARFELLDSQNKPGVAIDPTSANVQMGDKWSAGKGNNAQADKNNIKYDKFGIEHNKSEVIGVYDVDGEKFTRVNSRMDVNTNNNTWVSLTARDKDAEPIYMGTNPSGKGIATWGDKPFNVYSPGGFATGSLVTDPRQTTINNVRLSNDSADSLANIINDSTLEKRLMFYGNTSLDGKTRKIGMADSVDVYGDIASAAWASGQNVYGRDHVIAGDWAAWMRSDGTIQGDAINGNAINGNAISGNTITGNTITSTGVVTGTSVHGQTTVFAGNNAASMQSDGSIRGKTVDAEQIKATNNVVVGNSAASLASDGKVYGRLGLFDGPLVANAITARSGLSVSGKALNLASGVPFQAAGARGTSRFSLGNDGRVGVGIARPRAKLDVVGNMYVNNISRPPGSTDWLRINMDNHKVAMNKGVAIFNGTAIGGGGGLYVGGFKKVPDGTVQATSNVIAPSISRAVGENDWLRINNNNITGSGTAIMGSASVGKGLSVGSLNKTVEDGNVLATRRLCVNTTCLSENDIKKILSTINAEVVQAAAQPTTTPVPTPTPTIQQPVLTDQTTPPQPMLS